MSDFIQLTEIQEKSSAVYSRRFADERSIINTIDRSYELRKIIVNVEHISLLKENTVLKEKFEKDRERFPTGLDERQQFTTIQFGFSRQGGSSTLTFVGSLEMILEKLNDIN